MEPTYRGLGRCVSCFWLAVAFDVLGLVVLLIGVFVNVFFYDLLIYAGAIVIFLSLIWWVFWYSGNIDVPPAELQDDVGLLKKQKGSFSAIRGAVTRLSGRVSSGIRNSLRRNEGATSTRTSRAQRSTSTRTSRAQRSTADLLVDPETGHVSVALATVTPQGKTPHEAVSPVADCVVQIPHNPETSPT